MKIKSIYLFVVLAVCIMTGCKKERTAALQPLAAKISNTDLVIGNIKAEKIGVIPNVSNYELLRIQGEIGVDPDKLIAVYVAYKDVVSGQTIDFNNDDGHAFILHTVSPNEVYFGGFGYTTNGHVTITNNDLSNKKIEGRFSGALIDANNSSVSCTDGEFSMSY